MSEDAKKIVILAILTAIFLYIRHLDRRVTTKDIKRIRSIRDLKRVKSKLLLNGSNDFKEGFIPIQILVICDACGGTGKGYLSIYDYYRDESPWKGCWQCGSQYFIGTGKKTINLLLYRNGHVAKGNLEGEYLEELSEEERKLWKI